MPQALLRGDIFPATCPLTVLLPGKRELRLDVASVSRSGSTCEERHSPDKYLVIAGPPFFSQFFCYLVLCYSGKSPKARRKNMRKYHLQVLLTGWRLCSDSGHGLEGCRLVQFPDQTAMPFVHITFVYRPF